MTETIVVQAGVSVLGIPGNLALDWLTVLLTNVRPIAEHDILIKTVDAELCLPGLLEPLNGGEGHEDGAASYPV